MTRRMRVRFQLLERLSAPKVVAQRVPTESTNKERVKERELLRVKQASTNESEESTRLHEREESKLPVKDKESTRAKKASHLPHTPPHTREHASTKTNTHIEHTHTHAERSEDRSERAYPSQTQGDRHAQHSMRHIAQ